MKYERQTKNQAIKLIQTNTLLLSYMSVCEMDHLKYYAHAESLIKSERCSLKEQLVYHLTFSLQILMKLIQSINFLVQCVWGTSIQGIHG